jgi:hypothetical protein
MQWYIRSMHALRISVISSLLCLVFGQCAEAQQGLNNLWLGGFDSEGSPPFGGIDLDFQSGSMVVSTMTRAIGYRRTSANITDGNGNLLFSTNGAFLADSNGDTLLNGSGLNPSNYTSNYPEGLFVSQASLILPKPGSATEYYLFHCTIDEYSPNSFAQQLYLTTVDVSLNGGLGAATAKNEVLIADSLVAGRITAVRHANGRDWWVLCHRRGNDVHYRMLVSPMGVSAPEVQAIGVDRRYAGGQACFSPQGNRFACYKGNAGEDLDVFDFDRCTGLLSNPIHIEIFDTDLAGGVAFSPSGRYLYVSSVEDVYQYDMEAADIAGSMVHVAVWDGFYSPFPPQATLFDIAQLAPDGKIYIGTGNTTDVLHVIHDPDQPGLGCNLVQHGVSLPRYFENSLPNHPNYHLGPVDGSVCDSLGITVNVSEASLQDRVRVQPNPSNGAFGINYPAHAQPGLLEVLDATGRVAYQHMLSAWSTVHQVDLAGHPAGLYHCRLSWGTRSTSVRVILQP